MEETVVPSEEERIRQLRKRVGASLNERNPIDRGKVRRRAFWIANGCLLAFSLLIRLTSPTIVFEAVSSTTGRVAAFSATNVCEKVREHLGVIDDTPATDITVFNARIKEFDTYLRITVRHLPKYSEGRADLEFLTAIYALSIRTGEWCSGKTRHTPKAAMELKNEFSKYRNQFNVSKLRRPKRRPSWYLALSRMSMGVTEGMLAPLCIAWRTFEAIFNPRKTNLLGIVSAESRGLSIVFLIEQISRYGRLPYSIKLDAIFAPKDWRRNGIFFSVCQFYGLLVCCYSLAVLSHITKWRIFFFVAILTLLYGLGLFAFFVLQVNEVAIGWLHNQVNALLEWIDNVLL